MLRATQISGFLACLLTAGMASAEPTSAGVPLPAATTELHVLFTGHNGGFGSHRSSGASILLLWEYLAERGGGARIDRSGQAVLRRGDGFVFDPVELLGTRAVQWLGGKTKRATQASVSIPVLETDNVLVFGHPDDRGLDVLAAMVERNKRLNDQPDLRRRNAALVRHKDVHGKPIWQLRVGGQAVDPGRDPLAWDQWWGIRGTAQLGDSESRYFLVIKPWGGAPRRTWLLNKLRSTADLLVSTGGELSRYGWLTGKPSPFRDRELANLARLRYDALVPGRSELFYGADKLRAGAKRHGVKLLATNVYEARGPRKGKPAFARILTGTWGGVRVAVLGLAGQDAIRDPHDDGERGRLLVREPVREVARAIDELRRKPGLQPELVVVVTNCRGKALDDLVHQTYGIDLVLSQAGRFDLRPPTRIAAAPHRGAERLHGRSPLLVAEVGMTRVGRVTVTMTARANATHRARVPVRISAKDHLVGPTTGRDPAVHRAIAERSNATLGRREQVLMPALEQLLGDDEKMLDQVRNDPEFARFLPKAATRRWQQLWFTGRLWSQLVANVVLRVTGAEVALVPRRTHLSSTVPGPLTQGYVAQWLQTDDAIQLRRLSGDQLKRLVARLGDKASVTGIEPSKGLVAGRPIRANETYTVALTTSLARNPVAARALAGGPAMRRFRWEGRRLIADPAAARAPLGVTVLKVLQRVRQDDPQLGKATQQLLGTFLRPRGAEIEPRWEVAIKDLTLSFTQYANYPSAAWLRFPGVREQRVVTPNNYALGTNLHLRGGYSSASVSWMSSIKTRFARAVIDLHDVGAGEVTQENADDILAVSEAQFRRAKLQLGRGSTWALVPYINTTYDTEFTATVDNLTKRPFPRQNELRTSAGVVLQPGSWWRELRIAALTKADFAATKGAFEAGVLAGLKFAFAVGRAQLTIGGDLRWLAPSADDTAPDLGTIVQAQARLAVPITRSLAATLTADAFAFVPKLRRIDGPDGTQIDRGGSSSVVLSAGLSWKQLWKW